MRRNFFEKKPEYSGYTMDGIVLKKQRSVSRRTVSRDFANQPLESTVFSRDHRVLRTIALSHSPFKNFSRRSLGDIHRPSRKISRSFRRSASESSTSRLREFVDRVEIIGSVLSLSPRNSLRMALAGAMFFGVISTVAVSRFLGEHVLARESSKERVEIFPEQSIPPLETPSVLGEHVESDDQFVNEVVTDYAEMRKIDEKQALEKKIREMVVGYPIEDMVPFILEKDRIVASFLIAIAKKESAWGKRVPLLKRHDCFNYWGYRGKRRFMGTGGHTCFNSQKDAVDTVARRLEKLIFSEKVDTPAEMMVVWKCGYDCSTHDRADTRKWIQDVDLYFHQLDEEE